MDLRNFECNKLKHEFWQDWNARKHHDKNTKHPFDWSQTSGAQPGCLVQKLRCLGCFTNKTHTKKKTGTTTRNTVSSGICMENHSHIFELQGIDPGLFFPSSKSKPKPGACWNSRKAVKRAQPQWTVGYWTLKLSSFPGWCLKILFSLASELHCL